MSRRSASAVDRPLTIVLDHRGRLTCGVDPWRDCRDCGLAFDGGEFPACPVCITRLNIAWGMRLALRYNEQSIYPLSTTELQPDRVLDAPVSRNITIH